MMPNNISQHILTGDKLVVIVDDVSTLKVI